MPIDNEVIQRLQELKSILEAMSERAPSADDPNKSVRELVFQVQEIACKKYPPVGDWWEL